MSEISRNSKTTTVESNMKSEHNLYLACEDSSPRAFFFCTFSSCPLSFYCKLTLSLLLSLSQYRQPLVVFSTRLHKTHTLQRTSHVVLLMASGILGCQWTWRDAWVPLRACECKLTFLSVTDTYVRTLREYCNSLFFHCKNIFVHRKRMKIIYTNKILQRKFFRQPHASDHIPALP